MTKRKRESIASNPANFPVEISMLFERAAYNPVRVPEAGKGFGTRTEAQSARLVMAKWKSQMKRSHDCPKAFRDLIESIQFPDPVQEDGSWCFYIRPFGGRTVELVKSVVGTPVTHDEFWKTYTEGV